MKVTKCLYCGNKDLAHITHRSDNNGILRCARCGVMMVEHLSDDTEQLYTAEYFEKQEATKNGYTNYLSSPAGNLVGKYAFTRLFAREAGRHLDLGCADGSLMEIFASEGFAVQGLEISKDAVQIANTKGLDVRFSNLHGFPADLPKSSVITAFDLLEHADQPGTVLREVYKNLEKDGYFVFSTLSVRKNDPTDYWFNNSLEHYIYYNRENLAYVLTDVFGEGNFAFVEEDVNGIAEFWGFAKKGTASWEKALIERITDNGYDVKDSEGGYLLSLFYNQVSKFEVSRGIIEHFESRWPVSRTIEAKFYNYYFQGQLAKALDEAKTNKHLVPATRSIYWQALSHAEEEFSRIRQKDIIDEYNAEVLSLRGQLFKVRDELHTLRNSRVVGKVISARETVGDSVGRVRRAAPRLKNAPRHGVYRARKAVAKVLPPSMSRAIMKTLRAAKRRLEDNKEKPLQTKLVKNEAWGAAAPLLSIVIPYYNRADTIDDTLNSLTAQTFKNFEVILVDDGSTDKASVKKLKQLQQSSLSLQIVRQKNQGVAAARNNGIGKARGKYVICLDSDDMLDPTYIEKAVLVLETSPDVSLVTSHQDMFGVIQEVYRKSPYHPIHLYEDNMVITAAAFRKAAWQASGGYKSGIGYEDWEFWLNMAEHGYWGKLIPETLFLYRTSMQSRYVEDKDVHWNNIKTIRSLHPKYKQKVKALVNRRAGVRHVADTETALINTAANKDYQPQANGNPNVLITIPWMTFGGAETLIYNFCREIKDSFNISFVTGLKSEHEWEYKFQEISPHIYHLANLFEDEALYLEFISQYIETRRIDVLHIIHNGYVFDMLPEIKKRHPKLKVIVTVFNDRAPYCEQSIGYEEYVDVYSADNKLVTDKYESRLRAGKPIVRIPNGINAYEEFSQAVCDRPTERRSLGIDDNDLAVFFVGRLSEEKNPDVFLKAAAEIAKQTADESVRFYMIGDGPMKPEIEKMLKDIGSDRVTYLGYQAKVAPYLSAADIFVLPSSIEGFPLSILEAMAMEVVPIASAVGGVPDIIDNGEDGFTVEPGSVKEIVTAITGLSQDPAKLQAMKMKARQKIEHTYSNRILGDNYRAMYRSVLR